MPFIEQISPHSERDSLRLGFEIETLLTSKRASEYTIGMDLEAFADVICETYNLLGFDTAGFDMCTDIGKPWKVTKHSGWLLTSDKTIRGQTDIRCEFIPSGMPKKGVARLGEHHQSNRLC